MKNLSTVGTSFSGAMMARQDELNACSTVWQIQNLIRDVLEKGKLYPSAIEYGKKVVAKLSTIRTYQKGLEYIYNIILAGDSEGCFWTDDSGKHARGAKWK
jgi:hypothetical protein